MRRHLVTGVLIAVLAIIAYHFAYHASDAPAIHTNIAPAESSSLALHGQPTRVPVHVTKLGSPEERQEIANRIAAAHNAAQAAAHSAPAAPALPDQPADDTHDLDRVSAKALDALKEVIPFLADCYRTADRTRDGGVSNRAAVYMTMTGARDVGTLIDTDKMLDADRQPIDPALGDCLKTTLESLELPPLAEGDSLRLQYSFVFD